MCDNVDNDCNGSVDDGLVDPAINGAFVCSAGSTSLVCDPGFSDCDGDSLHGCEITTASDPENCGFCGAICPGIGDQDLGICTNGICQSP